MWMFIGISKVKFIINFFLEILHFKKPLVLLADSIWAYNCRPSFTRYGVGVEIPIKILVFTLDYFQEKLMAKFFKNSKKPYFGAMWPFWAKFGQKWIFLEKRLCQFLNIPSIYHHAKNQQKLICLPKKNAELTDGWKDRYNDGRLSILPSLCPFIHLSIHPSV